MASNEIEVLTETTDAATIADGRPVPAGHEVDRRRFLTALGMTGAVAGAGLIVGCNATTTTTASSSSSSSTQAQVNALNFALNLKYLSATFYAYVTTGGDISSLPFIVKSGATPTAGSGTVTGAPSATLAFTGANAGQIADMLNEATYDEVNHVLALRNVLGSAAVPRPALNLAAFGAITASNALSIARALEDLNVTAFAAVTDLVSSSSVTVAGQIMGVDSFHAGAIRLVSLENAAIAAFIRMDSLDVPVFDPGTAALAAAGPSANGGFFATAGAATATAAFPAGTSFTRTASQALAILYGSAAGALASSGTKAGGFFPNGVNGNIVSV